MGGRLLLLALLPIAIGLPMEHPSESENFIQGFSGTFAEGLPTNEFRGPLSELSRSKRGVSEHIASMLSEPYEGPQPSNIESLFQRNSLVRPVRQSLSSDSSRRFPEPFSPSTTFMDNFVRPPVRPTVRKPVPQRPRPSFQQPIQRPPKAQPTRQTVQQVERRPEIRPQQIFSPVSRFPSFSEAQEEHKRTNDEKNRHVSNVDSFFESARIRERRDVTSKQAAPMAEERADSKSSTGFLPNNFPDFQSIGGFPKMADEPDQSSNSFVPEFNPPQINIPDIQEEQPKFEIPSHFSQQRLDTSEPLSREQPLSRSRVAHWIFGEQFNEDKTDIQSKLLRKRRTAGEPDPTDPSQIPHSRQPRQHKETDQEKNGSELLMTKIPLTSISRSSHVPFESFPDFNFPTFESERLSDRLTHAKFTPNRFTSDFGSSLRNPSISESDHIIPESQRLYPTYNPRRNPFPPSSRKPFFPPTPRHPGPPRPRSHFKAQQSTRGPTFRPSYGPKGFSDFHDTFYGPSYEDSREAIHRPDFHFPSSTPHREDEYPNENSLLGSGNFEILRGGTFYEPGDYHLNHHPYDHLLDGGYSPFHSNSHSNNYVDDYFSNFRDFSEFAARSDSSEGEYHGFSEPVTSIIDPNADMDHTGEESSINETQAKPHDKINNSKEKLKTKKTDKDNTIQIKSPSHRQPKNIQEVLAELDPRPNDHSASELIVDEKDPMIAMF